MTNWKTGKDWSGTTRDDLPLNVDALRRQDMEGDELYNISRDTSGFTIFNLGKGSYFIPAVQSKAPLAF